MTDLLPVWAGAVQLLNQAMTLQGKHRILSFCSGGFRLELLLTAGDLIHAAPLFAESSEP